MHRKEAWFAVLLVAVYVLYPLRATTFSGGAPPERTGAPQPDGGTEQTCAASGCHGSFPLNGGSGRVIIDAPDRYEPDGSVDVTVRVDQADQVIFGFQLAVKDAGNEHVGRLELTDSNSQYASSQSEAYVTHDRASTQHEWTVRWIAPAEDVGSVTIYAAGNAANASGDPTGDYIYTASKTLTSDLASAAEAEAVPAVFTLDRAFPNPFTAQTTIRYALRQAVPVTLVVYDAQGRRVRRLELGTQAAGPHQIRLDAAGLSAGFYLYELRTPQAREARPLLLLK